MTTMLTLFDTADVVVETTNVVGAGVGARPTTQQKTTNQIRALHISMLIG